MTDEVPPPDKMEIDAKIAEAIRKDREVRQAEDDKSRTHFILPDLPKSWTFAIGGILIAIMVMRGNLTAEQAIKGLSYVGGVPAMSSSTVTVETKETGPNPPKIDAIKQDLIDQAKPTPHKLDEPTLAPRDISPEQQQKIIDALKFITDWIAEQNKPKPPTPVDPPIVPHVDPQPPTPKPADTLKLTLTDAAGLPVASSSVAAGKLILIKLEGFKGPKIEWTKRPTGDVQFADTGNQGAAVVLGSGSELDLFVTDYGVQQQVSLRIVAQNGGQPPPDNPPIVINPPINNPPPNNIPPGSKKYGLFVVEDPKAIRLEATARILNNLTIRNQLTAKGHTFTPQISTDNSAASNYVKQQSTPLPALAIYDNDTRQFVKSVALPSDLGLSILAGMGG